jgi:hypothetical protein
MKFADDTTVVGLITNNDETSYWEDVRARAEWCQENPSTSTKPRSLSKTSGDSRGSKSLSTSMGPQCKR